MLNEFDRIRIDRAIVAGIANAARRRQASQLFRRSHMQKTVIDSSILSGTAGSSTSGAPAPGPQPGTPLPSIATTLSAATLQGSQSSKAGAPALAPKSGNGTLKTQV